MRVELGGRPIVKLLGAVAGGVVTLSADPTVTPTGGPIGGLGTYGGHLYIHLTNVIDIRWLDLTLVFESARSVVTLLADPEVTATADMSHTLRCRSSLRARILPRSVPQPNRRPAPHRHPSGNFISHVGQKKQKSRTSTN